MPKRQFDRDDNAFNKLEKAVERLFDLGYSDSEILRSAGIRYSELAAPDYITDATEPDPATGWCDACGMEVTDPESACAGRDKTAEEVIIERLDALEREVLAFKNAEFLRKSTTINQPPWLQPMRYGMGGGSGGVPHQQAYNRGGCGGCECCQH